MIKKASQSFNYTDFEQCISCYIHQFKLDSLEARMYLHH